MVAPLGACVLKVPRAWPDVTVKTLAPMSLIQFVVQMVKLMTMDAG
jgi:hypothetical protein